VGQCHKPIGDRGRKTRIADAESVVVDDRNIAVNRANAPRKNVAKLS
jgi:hypothetical protein